MFPFSSDRVHLGHEDERRAHAMETHTWRCACACACAAALACVLVRWKDSRRRYAGGAREREGLVGLIGDTPLVRIRSLSEATGCEIFAKAEMLNPGGCIKDRVALQIVQEAIRAGKIKPGGLLCEGSAGSTGISLAMVRRAAPPKDPSDRLCKTTDPIRWDDTSGGEIDGNEVLRVHARRCCNGESAND